MLLNIYEYQDSERQSYTIVIVANCNVANSFSIPLLIEKTVGSDKCSRCNEL